MRCSLPLLLILSALALPARGDTPASLPGIRVRNLRSIAVGPGSRVYLGAGQDGKKSGVILVVRDDKPVVFASGLEEPAAMASFAEVLFVADGTRIWRIDKDGNKRVLVAAEAFPVPPGALTGLAVDENGQLYVTALGKDKGNGGAIYRVDGKGKVTLVSDSRRAPELTAPTALVLDGASFLLVLNGSSGELLRIGAADGKAVKILDGIGEKGTGLAWDWYGRLTIAYASGLFRIIPRPGQQPQNESTVLVPVGIALDPTGKSILVADGKTGTIVALPATVPGQPVDQRPMPLETAVAFPDLEWSGWTGEDARGKPVPLRPIVLTHAGDGSNRVFVATEHGVIHVFPNDPGKRQTQVFLDVQDRVVYDDNQNEEGFLGLAFHPRYKENGEFFVFYTRRKPTLTNVLSRFRVRKDDPSRADPASEEELLRIKKPFWNHNGGTLCFGPDGYLYLAIGDGGAANDPFNHGQDLGKLFGKVLRIDVDRKEDGRPYAIPRDNPFRNNKRARPEVWAYGLRNPWRIAFDRKTGKLWASDVGQNLYEEIDVLTAGGNYGWNLREGLHPFGARGVGPRKDLIEPIWEYHHDVGKSLTGGLVYRGKKLPELQGMYLYADYVSSRIWALTYDEGKGRVVANRPIRDPNVPVLSFGEDEQGEAYFMTYSLTGKGIYRFVRAAARERK